MRFVVAAGVVLLSSGIALADGSRTPFTPRADDRVAWTVMVSDAGGIRYYRPGKAAVRVLERAPWTCTMRPLYPGHPVPRLTVETVTVDCVTADAEVTFEQGCLRRNQPLPVLGEKQWLIGETLSQALRPRGQPNETVTINLRCDVDTRYLPQR